MNVIFWSTMTLREDKFQVVQRYIGPYRLGHWLKEHGYSYQVIDHIYNTPERAMSLDELISFTEKFIDDDTLVIGISCTFVRTFQQFLPELYSEAMQYFKNKYPKIKFVLGGSRAESYPESITRTFDAIMVGLAEDTMLSLLDYYSGKGDEPVKRQLLPHRTPFYYDTDVKNPKFDIQKSIHAWADNDIIVPGESLPLEISRGCIFKCKFCQYPLLGRDKFDYTRNMECIRQELIDNYEKYKTTNYYFLDDTFNDTLMKVKDFHAMTKTLPFKIRFVSYIRADLLHRFPEMILLLKDAGLSAAYFGIESLNESPSKLVGKAWSGKHGKEFLPKLIHEHWNSELLAHVNLICGLPGETVEMLYESLEWLQTNNIPSYFFTPLDIPNPSKNQFNYVSEFTKQAHEYGFTFDNTDTWGHYESGWDGKNVRLTSKVLNKKSKTKKFHGWTAFALLSLGYKFEDIIRNPTVNFNIKTIDNKAKAYMSAYKKMLGAYPNKVDITEEISILEDQSEIFK